MKINKKLFPLTKFPQMLTYHLASCKYVNSESLSYYTRKRKRNANKDSIPLSLDQALSSTLIINGLSNSSYYTNHRKQPTHTGVALWVTKQEQGLSGLKYSTSNHCKGAPNSALIRNLPIQHQSGICRNCRLFSCCSNRRQDSARISVIIMSFSGAG